MKNRYFTIAIAAIVLAVSCQREGFETVKMQELTFTASWEDEPVTRTVLDKDGSSVLWCPDEYFKVFSGTMSGQFYSMNADTTDVIEIRGGLVPNNGNSGSASGTYFALYPYSADAVCDDSWNGKAEITFKLSHEQNSGTGSFANNFAPAVAISNDFHFTFYNVCGGICFTLTEPGITEIKFSSLGNETLTGKVTVGFDSDGKPVINSVSDEKSYVTVTAPEDGFVPGEKYYAMILPGQISGIAATMIKGGRGIVYKLEKNLSVKRSVFGNLKDIDNGLWEMPEAASYEAVDLGLSVLWSSVNLGARLPEEPGNYYAWGETDIKDLYSWDNYKWWNGESITKYSDSPNHELYPEDDAATVSLGDTWRIPTESEWNELRNNCDWTFVNSGITGFLVTSRVSGYTDKSIFLPLSGRMGTRIDADGKVYKNIIHEANFQCRSFDWGQYARTFIFYDRNNTDYFVSSIERCWGISIRPVKEK